jgi:hypothetical protein
MIQNTHTCSHCCSYILFKVIARHVSTEEQRAALVADMGARLANELAPQELQQLAKAAAAGEAAAAAAAAAAATHTHTRLYMARCYNTLWCLSVSDSC